MFREGIVVGLREEVLREFCKVRRAIMAVQRLGRMGERTKISMSAPGVPVTRPRDTESGARITVYKPVIMLEGC
jgi:hypothetical protein